MAMAQTAFRARPAFNRHSTAAARRTQRAEMPLFQAFLRPSSVKVTDELCIKDATTIDPCSGSGHILVYMFDVLLAIYESEGISERDAVFDILEKNIFGLDIDKRAYQLSYFALMMKGRGVAGRRFFRGIETEDGDRRPIRLNVYVIDESNTVDKNVLDAYGVSMPSDEREKAKEQVETLLNEMYDAKEYGSIINVTDFDMELMKRYLFDRDEKGQLNLLHMDAGREAKKIWRLAKIGKVLAQKYDAVVTNPPYMGNSGMSTKLDVYVKENYADAKSDMFAVFIEKCNSICKKNGLCAMITQQAWMFLSSYEKLRRKLNLLAIVNMMHLGTRAFDEISGEVVQTTSFVIRNFNNKAYIGNFIRLTEYTGESAKREAALSVIHKAANKNSYKMSVDSIDRIPGMPYAYWVSNVFSELFDEKFLFSKYASAKAGLSTTDNNAYLRLWFEVAYQSIGFDYKTLDQTSDCKYSFIPEPKGGTYRKWYGNLDYVVNWYNNGEKIRKSAEGASGGRIVGTEYYFKEGVTWSDIASGGDISVRVLPKGMIFNSSAPSAFCKNENLRGYIMAFMNTTIAKEYLLYLAPSYHFNAGAIMKLPLIVNNDYLGEIAALTNKNIELSTEDWDSYELSWDFREHPLIPHNLKNYDIDKNGVREEGLYLEASYDTWKDTCDKRFTELKQNEEKLNRIFIDIYGLQDELTPDVAEKDVTVRRIFDTKDDIPDSMKGSNYAITKRDVIVSFISYAVGCMFGRYSLDEEGLVYAGGEFDKNKYKTLPADDDAIIPITDEEYFDDDIVKRFVEFVSVVYGEDTLEENLDFIADALGGKGTTSREIIRNYFLNDFFKEHAKTYSVTGSGKRPIYWLFDSGKQNGFKCLIYMHRYTPDTVGLIRSVYLKKASDAIQKALDNAEYIIANTESNVDRALSTKKRDKYVKQLAEIKPYYQALSHVAMQRIELDLDDGVKINYAKFQGIEVGGDGEKKQTINLLAKI